MRHQLRQTSIKVFEIIPPTVDAELDKCARGRRSQAYRGILPNDVAVAALEALAKDEFEKAVGQAESLRMAARMEPEQRFQMMNSY